MTLLTVAQQICRETGVDVPSIVVGSTNDSSVRVLAALQSAGESLASGKITLPNGYTKQHDWTALIKEQTFSTTSGTADYALSGSGSIITDGDFGRFVAGTRWDRANQNEIKLFTPAQWQESKSGITTRSTTLKRARKRGRFLSIDPTPSSTETLVFEYVSKYWCESASGTGQSLFQADADTVIVDERLLKLDAKWRFLNYLGSPYAEELAEALAAITLEAGSDITPDTTSFIRSKRTIYGNHGNYNTVSN